MSFASGALASASTAISAGGTFANVIGLIGTVATAIGQVQESRAQAQAAEFNASVSRQQAQLARERGAFEVKQARKRAESFRKKQVSLFAKAGVKLDGSPLEVIIDDATDLELDALIIDHNAKIEALNQEQDASLQLLKAQSIRTTGFLNAGSTLLTASKTFIPRIFGQRGNQGGAVGFNTANFRNTGLPGQQPSFLT